MRTLDRYVLIVFARIFFTALVVLMVFYEIILFMDYHGYFVKFEATPGMIGRYLLFKAPVAFLHVTPICVLIASIMTSAKLSRTSELTAMNAAGISLFRVAAPVVIAGALASVLAFVDAEALAPLAARESNRIYVEEIKKQVRNTLFAKDRFWYKGNDGAIWNIGHIGPNGRSVHNISIYRFDKSGERLVTRIVAREATYTAEGLWKFFGIAERHFEENGSFEEFNHETKLFPGDILTVADFEKVELDPEEMNLGEITEYINDLADKGYDATRYIADRHGKLAFPLICLVMPLIAFPLGVRTSRQGGAYVAIGIAMVTGLVFWFLFSMGLAVGRAGRIPPAVGAWSAHILFATAGLYLLIKRR